MKYYEALARISARARRLAAAATASWTVLGTGMAAFLTALSLRLIARTLGFPALASALLVVIPFGLGILAYAFAVRRALPLAPLLLRVDFALGLSARLSSLYEISRTNPDSFVFRRLQAETAPRLADWREALPISRAMIARTVVGVLCVGGAMFLSIGLAVPEEARPDDATRVSETGSRGGSDDAASGAALPPDRGTGELTRGSEVSSAQHRADEVLADLGLEPGLAGPGERAPGAIEEETRRGDAPTLEELISAARARVGEDDGEGLSVEEQEALRDAAATFPGPVRRAIEGVLQASSPEETRDALDQLARSVELAKTFPEEEETETSRVDTDQESEKTADSVPGSALLAAPEDDSGGGLPPAPDDAAGDEDAPEAADVEGDEGAEPGEEGPPVPVDVGPESVRPPGFVLEKTPSSVGDAGDVKSFLTVGVPLEFETGDEGDVAARVSFERIESIVSSRELAGDVAEMVRKYFEAITEGGT